MPTPSSRRSGWLQRAESQSPMAENARVHKLHYRGCPCRNRVAGAVGRRTVCSSIDWEDPDANDWLVVNQFSVVEDGKTRRPDAGVRQRLPLGLLELKNPANEVATLEEGVHQIGNYRSDILSVFTPNAVTVSDGTSAAMRSFTGGWGALRPVEDHRGQRGGHRPAGTEVPIKGCSTGLVPDLVRNSSSSATRPSPNRAEDPRADQAGRQVPPVLGGQCCGWSPLIACLPGRGPPGRGGVAHPGSGRAWRWFLRRQGDARSADDQPDPWCSSPTATTSTTSCSGRCSPARIPAGGAGASRQPRPAAHPACDRALGRHRVHNAAEVRPGETGTAPGAHRPAQRRRGRRRSHRSQYGIQRHPDSGGRIKPAWRNTFATHCPARRSWVHRHPDRVHRQVDSRRVR